MKWQFNSLILALIGGLFAHSVTAQTPRRLSIQSPYDQFELVLNSKKSGTIDGKAANLKSLDDLWPVLDNPIGNACPTLKGAPEITVKEAGKTRSIYVKQGIVAEGKACLNVGGEGLLYFPVHREFLIGPKRDSIKLNSPVKVFRQGVKLLELKREGDTWVSDNPELLLNWAFIERFENTLREFDVRLRVQSDITVKGKTKMIVQSGDQTYEFYKVTNVMWAVKKPGSQWLVSSDDWSFWYDFDQAVIEDRFAPEIRTLKQAGVAPLERQAAMDKLDGAWSRNLRDLYHAMLLNPQEDKAIQGSAIARLKRKPSLETSGVMVQFLNQSNDEDLKRVAGQILKIHYPKGPLYKPNLSAGDKGKVLEFWNNWWKKNQRGR